jgi:quercetin dioxygenase-like cupin family protein
LKVLNINDVEGERLGNTEAIRKILVYNKDLMLMYAEAPPKGPPLSHSHPNAQLGFILEGTVELTASGETVVLGPGSSYLLEPNEHHVFKGVGDEKIVLLDIFHPYREDYLPKK